MKVIFKYTLYWTLVFNTPLFIACGLYAFINITFPPKRLIVDPNDSESIPLTTNNRQDSPRVTESFDAPLLKRKPRKENERRSRLAFTLLVLLAFATTSLAGSVISAAIVGYFLVGFYRTAGFAMST
jgi:hypothetical protein